MQDEIRIFSFVDHRAKRQCDFNHEDETAKRFIAFVLSGSAIMSGEIGVESMLISAAVKYVCHEGMPTLSGFLRLAADAFEQVDKENRDNPEFPRMPSRRSHA